MELKKRKQLSQRKILELRTRNSYSPALLCAVCSPKKVVSATWPTWGRKRAGPQFPSVQRQPLLAPFETSGENLTHFQSNTSLSSQLASKGRIAHGKDPVPSDL